jgi:hypothetical protein
MSDELSTLAPNPVLTSQAESFVEQSKQQHSSGASGL